MAVRSSDPTSAIGASNAIVAPSPDPKLHITPSSHPALRLDLELGRSMTKGFAELFSSRPFVKISALALTAIVSFYLGRRWSDSYPQLVFFTSGGASDRLASPSVAVSPNANLTLDVSALTSNTTLLPGDADALPPLDADLPPSSPPPEARKVGIVDANGTMSVGFDAGELDPDMADGWDDEGSAINETAGMGSGEGERRARVKIDKFKVCPQEMREWIPCMDNEEVIKKLNSTERGERFERHCPLAGKGLDCLVPAPQDYKKPIPWPQSRDEVGNSLMPNFVG